MDEFERRVDLQRNNHLLYFYLFFSFRATLTRVLKGNFVLNLEPNFVENLFSQFRVNCIASGQMEGEMKFYFFSKHV